MFASIGDLVRIIMRNFAFIVGQSLLLIVIYYVLCAVLSLIKGK